MGRHARVLLRVLLDVCVCECAVCVLVEEWLCVECVLAVCAVLCVACWLAMCVAVVCVCRVSAECVPCCC